MTALEEELPLASEFPAASREQWQQLVEGVLAKSGQAGLAGAAAEEALATEVEDGLRGQPPYTGQDPAPEAGRPGVAAVLPRRAGAGSGSHGVGCPAAARAPRPAAGERAGARRPGERRHVAVADA